MEELKKHEMKMAAATAVITATARTTTVNTKYINNYNCNNINNYNSKCNISNNCKSSNIELQQGHEAQAEVYEASFVSKPVQLHVLSKVCKRLTAAPCLSSAVFIAQKILIQLIPNRFRGQAETGCSLSVNFSYKHFGPVRQQR